ncbi:hypothetical protein AAT16_03635 [Salinicoccus halodurans]|uniref:Uncharacterized protein n=1 Tax=Salinicoccus halodurans TaxID=407035 RepID=A0ABN4FYK2_9STAP|nr:hypothetical protein AAT16_03635 [Salinicoccus halodurans]
MLFRFVPLCDKHDCLPDFQNKKPFTLYIGKIGQFDLFRNKKADFANPLHFRPMIAGFLKNLENITGTPLLTNAIQYKNTPASHLRETGAVIRITDAKTTSMNNFNIRKY